MCEACNPGAAAIVREASRRHFLKGSAASLYALSSTTAVAQSTGSAADTIFFGGPIHTMAGEHDIVDALAVQGGRIVAVGGKDAVMARRGADTRLIDLAGRTMLPGFIDPHMHASMTLFDDWADIGPFTTATVEEALDKIAAEAHRAHPGDWVRGRQFDPSLMPGDPITRARLDKIAPDNPVFILESNGHIAYANSKALELSGITHDTPDPAHGRYIRDTSGELTGRIEEAAAFGRIIFKMKLPSGDETKARMKALFAQAASVGCTALQDCAVGSTAFIGQLTEIAADAPVRLGGFLTSDRLDAWTQAGIKPGGGSDRFRLNGIKFWADGSNQAGTGFQREPYLNSANRGHANFTLDQLKEGIGKAHRLGWQVAVHANGDAAIDIVLDAFEAALTETPRADHRHRIEHCSMLHPEQMARMAKLGISPSFLIGHVHYWGRAFRDRILGPERVKLYDPCASALAHGLRISLHSDYNVTPIDPLRCVSNAVNRDMRDGGEVLNPAERITVRQALCAVTIDAAWQCRMDDVAGSLEAGKYADLVILDRDPFTVDAKAVGTIKVRETWSEGRRTFAV